MGYRPNIVTEPRDYGSQISGFNYNADEFEFILDELFGIEYVNSDNQENFYEIENSEVEKLKAFNIEAESEALSMLARDFSKSVDYVKDLANSLKNSLISGLDTNYSKKLGYVAIEWF